jgi:hypothetical protein
VFEFSARAVITADPEAVWRVVTDVEKWPSWDPHERAARLDGPFAPGSSGWSKPRGAPAADWTITAVTPGRAWTSTSPLPGGELIGVTGYEPLGDGRIRCTRTMRARGPLTAVFRLHFARRIRADWPISCAALERVAAASAR